MTYAVMWSGGKDSALALARARDAGLEIGALLNFVDVESRRVRFHATRAELIGAQADAIGVPLRQYATAWDAFERTFRAALDDLAAQGYAGVVFGDIHLADVRVWYERRVRASGLEHVEPLWGEAPLALLREFVGRGGRAVLTCCELARLSERWLGRVVDERFVDEVATEPIDPCGENGEYHSFAFAGPPFRTPVDWVPGPRRREAGFLQLDLLSPVEAALATARATVAEQRDLAAAVLARRPKAWGELAAKAIVAHRRWLGRALEDRERRAVWHALWEEIHRER